LRRIGTAVAASGAKARGCARATESTHGPTHSHAANQQHSHRIIERIAALGRPETRRGKARTRRDAAISTSAVILPHDPATHSPAGSQIEFAASLLAFGLTGAHG
jgi:hypothetical protein